MPRFFVPSSQINLDDKVVVITGDDAHHVSYSLRMATKDTITVCDMHGFTHLCELVQITPTEVVAKILQSEKGKTESPVSIHLFMGYPKGDKLETVIQKAVELGVDKITPFESERCIKRPPKERIPKILERLNKIAIEAAKQCGRSKLPIVLEPISYKEMLASANQFDLALFCYEGDDTISLKTILSENENAKTISCIVGAEGGFSQKEALLAKESGMVLVNLGPRILRCETAPSYILSAISYFFEL